MTRATRALAIASLGLCLVEKAGAVTFSTASLPLSGTPVDVALVGGTIYVAETGGWERSDGTIVTTGTPPVDVPDVLAAAVLPDDGSGLWGCNSDGLWRWDRAPAVPLTTNGCSGLTADGARVLYAATTLHLWDGSADADLGQTADLYALAPESFAYASAGDSTLSVLDSYGVSSIAAGGTLSALATGPTSDWLLGTEGPAQIRETGVDNRLLAFVPTQVGRGDFDGDGIADRWAYGDGYFYVWTAAGEEVVTGVGGSRVAIGDVDRDGCSDAVAISGDLTLHVSRVTDCSAVDSDGDGSPDPLDCDDANPTVYPGAPEACDGIDQDCDGIVDETGGVFIETLSDALEGQQFTVSAAGDGCAPGTAADWAWTFTGDATCAADGATATCAALDNTTFVATCTLTNDDGSTAAGSGTIDVANVAPVLDVDATDWGGHDEGRDGQLELVAGESVSIHLVADDVAADTIAFALQSAPAGIDTTLSLDGTWTVTASGTNGGDVVYTISDEDGGVTEVSMFVGILDNAGDSASFDTGGPVFASDDCGATTSPSCSGLCCVGSGLMLSVFLRRLIRL